MTTGRLGVTIPFEVLGIQDQRALVESLPDAGYTDVWSGEADGFDGIVPLAMSAAWCPSLYVGTGVLPVQTRGPAVLAQTAGTLACAAPGRVIFGIGASSRVVVEDWNGVDYRDPYRHTRDTLRFLRRALSGEEISEEYSSFTIRGFRLRRPPDVAPEIVLAALRPGMLRLAGREADGVVLNLLSPDDVRKILPYVEEGGAGRQVIAKILVCPRDDPDARAGMRRILGTYLNIEPYASFHDWLGRGERLGPSREAWRRGDRHLAIDSVPDELIDDLAVYGSPEACGAGIQAYVDSGVTVPIVGMPLAGPGFVDDIRAVGEAFRR